MSRLEPLDPDSFTIRPPGAPQFWAPVVDGELIVDTVAAGTTEQRRTVLVVEGPEQWARHLAVAWAGYSATAHTWSAVRWRGDARTDPDAQVLTISQVADFCRLLLLLDRRSKGAFSATDLGKP